MKNKAWIIMVFLLMGWGGVCGQVLAGWDFIGLSDFGPSPMTPRTKDANVTVVGLARGSGLTTSGNVPNKAWGAIGWDGNTNKDEAIAAGDYETFSIKPNSGYEVSLASIGAYNIRRSVTGPTTGIWHTL